MLATTMSSNLRIGIVAAEFPLREFAARFTWRLAARVGLKS
jgi:hypothetical protein